MTINNPVLFGLKVSSNFADIESKSTALNNLGLDIRDLETIEGIAPTITRTELQQVSGLDVNLTKYIDRLKSDTSQYSNLIAFSSGYDNTTRGNLEAFGAVSGGAVRYQYVPNDKGTNVTTDDLKFGDISTSRVSAWSGGSEANPTEAISYGASVQVRGSLKLGQDVSYSVPANEAILKVLDNPEPVRFDTEVPTEILKININGQDGYVYAMKGIPQIFTIAFKRLTMTFGHNPYPVNGVNLTPIYTFTDTDNGNETVSRPNVSSGNSTIRFNSSQFKEREMRVYYPPKFITTLTANNCNIGVFPNVKYPNITNITMVNNILSAIPDFKTISYEPTYNTDKTEITDYNSVLRTINMQNNRFYLDSDEDQRFLGSHTMKRLPTSTYTINFRGCYNQHSEFKDANDFLVLKVTLTEYNNIRLDPENKQTFTFTIGTTSGVDIKGIYFDKYTYSPTGAAPTYYVYIEDPSRVGTTDTLETIPDYQNQVEVLDLFTRTPRLRYFNIQNLGNRRIYRTGSSKYVDLYNTPKDLYGYVDGVEITPRVNLNELQYFNIYDCYFTKLNPIWEQPTALGGLIGNSPLQTFQVGENEALTSSGIDFSNMNSINSISIYDTALPIPSGLANKTSLTNLNCNYTRFPDRGGVVDHLAPGGQPEIQDNDLWNGPNPSALSDYALSGCINLRNLRFYAARLDGMIPKFIGNTQLRSVDFRNTFVEGGRPGGAGAVFNGGDHGRRYIMWDDTFQDAQRVSAIRIFSNNLGRNIGTWNAVTASYEGAEFQDGTFSLPSLSYLLIDTNGNYLNGSFFSTGGAPALRELHSNGVGWGEAFTDGTPFPSFAGNTNLYRVDLRNNKFKGTITLNNLNRLRFFYASQNIISSIGALSNLNRLNYFYAANNQISGSVPDFSVAAPNLQFCGLNNNQINAYTVGSLRTMTRLRSLDLSNNLLNESNIDSILEDLLINYNNARRSGVTINLGGTGNSPPSANTVTTPTSSTSKTGEELLTVNQDPLSPTGTFNLQILNISNATTGSPPNTTVNFARLYIDGTEVILPSAFVQLDYANDQVEFQPGFEPTTGTQIKVEQYQTVNGEISTTTGGITVKTELNAKGWTVITN